MGCQNASTSAAAAAAARASAEVHDVITVTDAVKGTVSAMCERQRLRLRLLLAGVEKTKAATVSAAVLSDDKSTVTQSN